MAQIEFTGLTRSWTPFATIVGTVDANTTYYISFNHLIEYDGSAQTEPGFQINKIQFDVAV